MDEEQTRLYLHSLLEAAFPDMDEVYFRPPGDMRLKRPCVVYAPLRVHPSFANSFAYVLGTRFQVTFLSDLPGLIMSRRMYSVQGITVVTNNSFVANDIVNDVYTITVNALS